MRVRVSRPGGLKQCKPPPGLEYKQIFENPEKRLRLTIRMEWMDDIRVISVIRFIGVSVFLKSILFWLEAIQYSERGGATPQKDLVPFENSGDALASTNTGGNHPEALVLKRHFVEKLDGEFGARATQGMAKSNGTSVYIYFLWVEIEFLNDSQGL